MSRDYNAPETDDYDDDHRGAGVLPHRGVIVLVMGILGLMFTCFIFGIIAIVMGRRDLALIAAGRMDKEGKALTQVGYILGIVSTVISLLVILIYVAMIALVVTVK